MSTLEPTASPAARASWLVRDAEPRDAEQVAMAVAMLLAELGGSAPPAQEMREAALELIEDPTAGATFLAESRGTLLGVLCASWQSAIHVPGRYALIQDLWVEPSRRSEAIGAALLGALIERVREQGVARIEVGLPKESFAGLQATASFYRANGFTALGPRMRVVLT